MIGNNLINFLLHTPLRSLMGNTMQITVTGRKSGKHYSLPVGYVEQDGFLWVMSARDRTWWRNVRGGAPVEMYMQGETHKGTAEVLLEDADVRSRLGPYFSAFPEAARSMHVNVLGGEVSPADAARLVRERLFIRIKLSAN
jgi:deazaflavin-dependent oxidoreductase (nitroreductase family)